MTSILRFAAFLLLTLPLLGQDKAADKQAPVATTKPQSAAEEKSLGQVARESKQTPKPPASTVIQNDDLAPVKSDAKPSSNEQEDIVRHFQEFSSSHTQEETRSELQSWMHTELVKLLGNKPADSNKTTDQLLQEAQKQAPDSDAARIEQLLQQIREAGLIEDKPTQDSPHK